MLDQKSTEYQDLSNREGISVFYYEDNVLSYWSDHSIPVPDRWRARLNRPFLSLRNADYVSVIKTVQGGRLVGLIEIRTHFTTQNEFLENGYQRDIKLDRGVDIDFFETDGSEPVYNEDGVYLFSLNFSEAEPASNGLRILAFSSLLLSLILLYAGFFSLLRNASGRGRYLLTGVISILLVGSALAVLRYSFPSMLTETDLFQPELFASKLFPSLGALLVCTVSLLALGGLYYLYLNLEGIRSAAWKRGVAVLLFLISAVILLAIEQLISSLVLDSNISFEAHRVTNFTGNTMVGLAIVIMWFVLLGLLMDKAIVMLSGPLYRPLLYGAVSLSLAMLVASLLPGVHAPWTTWLTILLLLGGHLYMRFHHKEKIPFSRFIFLLLFVSLFMTLHFQENNRIDVERQREVELVKLSSEHDPVAEMLFSEMSMAIRNDSVFAQFLNQPYIPIDPVVTRLSRNYLSGYWSKYDLVVTVCRPDDRVLLPPPEDDWYPCYSYFNDKILQYGIEITGSDFYFLDNLNGRISYLASIPYYHAESEHRVFIELDSKILSEELGYPELLLDENYTSFTSSDFSFARYNGGNLFTQDGEFPYRRSCEHYTTGKKTFETITMEGYDHSIYNVDDQNTIIVGSPTITPVDMLISFSYIFALNFLLLALFYLLLTVPILSPSLNWSFKNRIQYSLVGILFLTFLLICSGTIYFIVQQYRAKNNDNLRNTMRSVYIELIHKVEYEEDLRNWSSDSYYNLDELLIKFSNVFYSDINLWYWRGSYINIILSL